MGWLELRRATALPAGILSPRARLFLYAIAFFADKEGKCWPTNAKLMRVAEASRAGLFRSLAELSDAGYIKYKPVRKRDYHYEFELQLEKLPPMEETDPEEGEKVINNSLKLILKPEKKQPQQSQIETKKADENLNLRLNGEQQSQIDTQKNILYNNTLSISKLVSKKECTARGKNVDNFLAGATELTEELPVPHGAKRGKISPAATIAASRPGEETTLLTDYKKLIKTYGWSPENKADIIGVWREAFEMGMSKDEADEFIRFNCAKRWGVISKVCTVRMLCHRWIKNWKKMAPSAFLDEQARRREESRQKVLAARRKAREEENDNK